jgi:hypothetical protein
MNILTPKKKILAPKKKQTFSRQRKTFCRQSKEHFDAKEKNILTPKKKNSLAPKIKRFGAKEKKHFGAITFTRQNLNNLSSDVWPAIGDTGHLVGNGHLSLRYGEEKLILHA